MAHTFNDRTIMYLQANSTVQNVLTAAYTRVPCCPTDHR